jgi:competence protein ComEA
MFLKVFQPIINFIMAAFVGLFLLSGHAFAKVEINSADQAALESVRGLGPSKAKAILLERKKNGPFKNSADLHTRVKGIGEKTVERLMQNGLTINNKTVAGASKDKPTSNTKEASSKRTADKEKESGKKAKSEKASSEKVSSEKAAKQSRKAKEDPKEGKQNNQRGREAS